jgi:hypothetical protein
VSLTIFCSFKISKSIPGELAKLERREQITVAKNEALERRIGLARAAKTVGTAALAVVSGVAIVVFPPMMIILPVGLPIAILALEAYEQRSSKQLKSESDTYVMPLENITNMLQNAMTKFGTAMPG